MKNKFLRALNLELRYLKKKERSKYLNDYEEIILDKMENGISEEKAVSDLGNVSQIAKDILDSYAESDRGIRKDNLKYFNRMYILIDAIVLIVSYLLAYSFWLQSDYVRMSSGMLPLSTYMVALLYILPCYLIVYYLFELYTVKCVQRKFREILNVVRANITGLVIFLLLLYISGQFFFSRIMIVMFGSINIMLLIVIRNVFLIRKGYYGNKRFID